MTGGPVPDWGHVRLVVFDVDGTLYDQRALRRRMVPRLLWGAATGGGPRLLRIVAALRRERERLAEAGTAAFEPILIARVARGTGAPEAQVRAALSTWLGERPLPHLAPCVVPGADALFAALRRSGRRIGIWSDYPARAKIGAMGLSADAVVSATDPEVGRQKPDPAGLRLLLEREGIAAAEALMIGDRTERDGEAARRLGVPALIRRTRPGRPGDFERFDDPVFAPLLGPGGGHAPRRAAT